MTGRAQMALPLDRRNGATTPAAPSPPAPAPASSGTDPTPAVVPPVVVDVPIWVRRTTTLGVLTVALVAGVGSYEHMRALGVEVGEGWRAGLLPLSVDGLAVVASMTLLVRKWTGQRGGLSAWFALVLSLGVSLSANVASAEPTLAGRLWAAWPPLALLLAIELLMQQIKARGGHGVQPVHPGASNPLANGGDRP